jgi:hypothetical protein
LRGRVTRDVEVSKPVVMKPVEDFLQARSGWASGNCVAE